MSDNKRGGTKRRSGPNVGRKSKNSFVTKSGQTIRVNQSLTDRFRSYRDNQSRRKAERLAGMPKSRVKRFFYRLHPVRMYKYWFSREGAIMALKVTGLGLVSIFILIVGVFAYFRKDLPNIKDVSGNNIGGSILYYDRTGQTLLWEDVDGVKRIPVKDEDISPYIKQATVAIEDKDFFKHNGFDMRGIVRAGVNNVTGSTGGKQGGSTITQQLVRLTQKDVGTEQTYKRKIKELILSVQLEHEYPKKDILTGYLNTAPYGGIEYGVEAGARDYFNKSAKDLTLDEAAMMASIPKAPTYYSPYNKINFDKDALIGRQHYVLDLMEQQHMITAQQRDDAKKVDVLAKVQDRKPRYDGIKAPWFVLTAKEQLERQFGNSIVKRGGWKVTTTLDLNAQQVAEEQVAKGLAQVKRQGGDTISFAAEDVKTGQVVALVGGTDFSDPDHGQNNYARLELPPGSSFKPYDYSALIDTKTNVGAGSVIYDNKGPIPPYYMCTTGVKQTGGNCAHDVDFRYPGPITIRYALGGSRNVPAIKAMQMAGVDKTIDIAHRYMTNFGTDGKPDPTVGTYKCYQDVKNTQATSCGSSASIGDGAYLRLNEHVHGYGTISRNGLNIPQTFVLKVVDSSGKTLQEWKPSKGVQAVKAETAYIIADILSDPNPSYFPSGNKPQRYNSNQGTWKFGVKTGTTNDAKDGMMLGFSTQYAAGIWVGYHNRERAMSGSMEVMTQPIWQGWMRAMHASLKPEERSRPSGVQTLPAFIVRSHVGYGSIEPSTSTDLFPSWYTGKKGGGGKKQTLDIVSNKLATECTPTRSKKEVDSSDSNSFSVDTFVGTGGAVTDQTDDVHVCGEAQPTISLSYNAGTHQLTATATPGAHPLSGDQFTGTINFIVDGQIVNSAQVSDDSPVATYTPDLNFDGSKDFSAQIIDSVLYDATSSSVSVTGTANTLNITDPHSGQSIGGAYNVKWTGGTGPFTVKVDGTSFCNNTNSTNCAVVVPGAVGSSHTITVTGSSGSDSVNIKK